MRVYLPSTLTGLAGVLAADEVGPPPIHAYAVTPALREAYASGDDEELEYVAMSEAARQSLRLLAADADAPPRRVVLAADVPDGEVSWIAYDDEPAAVVVSAAVPLAKVASGHIDDPEAQPDVAAAADAIAAADAGDDDASFAVDSAEAHELAWYATQELQYLLSARSADYGWPRWPEMFSRRRTIDRLVLWNIDLTLLDVEKVARVAYAEAFAAVTGRPLVQLPQVVGYTEPEIFFDALGRNGVSLRADGDAERLVKPFGAEFATRLASHRRELTTQGHLMPGAAEAVQAVARLKGVVQSVLTGSSRPNATLKLRAFGLERHLDLAIGGFAGSEPYPKGALLSAMRLRAEEKYRTTFADRATIYVADSPRDIEAAKMGDAASVGVAAGRASAAELRSAGADLVMQDLTNPAPLIALIQTPS